MISGGDDENGDGIQEVECITGESGPDPLSGSYTSSLDCNLNDAGPVIFPSSFAGRKDHCMVQIDPTRTFVGGGFIKQPDETNQPTADAFIYNWDDGSITQLPDIMAGPVGDHACGMTLARDPVENRLVPSVAVMGGIGSFGPLDSTWFLNTETLTWVR